MRIDAFPHSWESSFIVNAFDPIACAQLSQRLQTSLDLFLSGKVSPNHFKSLLF